jgi:hypothetical protein
LLKGRAGLVNILKALGSGFGKWEREIGGMGVLVEKKKGQGVLGKKLFFFLPLESEQREGGGTERRPARGRGAPAVPPMATAGKWLKMERRPRGSIPVLTLC